MKKKGLRSTPRISNRKAGFRYHLLEKIECGIVLTGTEVKSLRAGGGSLEEAFAQIRNEELWLYGCHIPPYEHAGGGGHDPTRPRKLLAHKRQIRKLAPKLTLKGLTLVPTDVHFNERGIAKVTIALAQGKATSDKRESIKKREAKREMDRAMRRR